jgi:hypothetical protein
MEQSVSISSKSKLRSRKTKNPTKKDLSIIKANFLVDYNVLLSFSNGKQKIINFQPLFLKYAKGHYSKYLSQTLFAKFQVVNGNIFWGKNEDIIFPVSFVYNNRNAKIQKEEILYVI